MTLLAALHHETRYRYDRPVGLGPQVIRLRPAPHCRTPIRSYSLRVEPAEHFLNWQQDPQGNYLARVVVPEECEYFSITVDLVADMAVINPFDFFLEESATHVPFEYEPELRRELLPFLEAEPSTPLLSAWVARVPRARAATMDFLVELNQRVQRDITYVVRLEPGVQTPEETLELGSGSCRDSAWLLVQVLRQLGIAARFASGYLIQLTPDVPSLDGPSGPSADFTDLHAWTEAYLPGAGWIGLDPTSGLIAGEGHIPLACSPRPSSAAPITGAVDECEVEFEHAMSVARIVESPRVTKPYDDEQWKRIENLGDEIDRRLEQGDVRLTMGGEPTFVSIDDMQGGEWNTLAVGPMKRGLASDLAKRLQRRFAPSGLLHYGQGKWYPGEPLPRWAFSIYWRKDGVALWRDADRIADERADYAPTPDQAKQLAEAVAARLEIAPEFVVAAYEDPLHAIGSEFSLPENEALELATSDLDSASERARLIASLSRGLASPRAFVLPVQAWNAKDGGRRWLSDKWTTRRGRLYLAPGDSPAGFRLPLGSLPSISPLAFPYVIADDPSTPRTALRTPPPRRQPFLHAGESAAPAAPGSGAASSTPLGNVRVALVVEPRDGRLCVFLPPTETADDYVEILAAVEDASAEHGARIHIEGYAPPADARLQKISVTPDPGVIEVNVHPTASWRELVEVTTTLYEDARAARLGTEKFMLDGRHSGTGGGNHVVLGGATPADSPFLRRPDLLRSMIGYWLAHPSLSYLFSGLFIGPTSQSPRIDEARHEAVYELGIAFDELERRSAAGNAPPWLVDRALRDLLVDVTGNTHRSEFCIDKLYSPDSAAGRLGLLELRAFEMPPHARMSLAQQLLLRALVAHFWDRPYRRAPKRWGTALHDRFLLPHFVWSDFAEVVADLREDGIALEASWFAPHFEFRFPVCGVVRYADVELELRQALEPWNVLGEEGAIGGTARYVDSSLDRLQVRARGLDANRYAIGCNGVRVPLHPTEARGDYVGAIRFRAWQPARCLHPTIPVDSPLTFDLVDLWNARAVAGCAYHVAHPGGRNYETFPVNSYEAEGRRLARFSPDAHTPGTLRLREFAPDPDFPLTLDLRRCARPA